MAAFQFNIQSCDFNYDKNVKISVALTKAEHIKW